MTELERSWGRLVTAREWDTEEAMKKHLQEHPGAKPSSHWVKGEKPGAGEEEEPKGEKPEGKAEGEKPKAKKIPEGKKIKDLTPEEQLEHVEPEPPLTKDQAAKLHREEIPEYNLVVVAGEGGKLAPEDISRAREVAKKLRAGIDEAADYCNINPPACRGNLGITRDNMPQVMDAPLKKMMIGDEERIANFDEKAKKEAAKNGDVRDAVLFDELSPKKQKKLKEDWALERRKAQAAIDAGADPDSDKTMKDIWLDKLKQDGIKITDEKVPVGKLRASQAEIKAGKSYGIANDYLNGNFAKLPDMPILVAKEKDENGNEVYTVIDGHHRYAGLLTADPTMPMAVQVINAPIREALSKAFETPGVFRADIQDNIVSMDKPLDMARKNGETWKQPNGKFYGKNMKGKAGGPFESEDKAKAFATGSKGKGKGKAEKKGSLEDEWMKLGYLDGAASMEWQEEPTRHSQDDPWLESAGNPWDEWVAAGLMTEEI